MGSWEIGKLRCTGTHCLQDIEPGPLRWRENDREDMKLRLRKA